MQKEFERKTITIMDVAQKVLENGSVLVSLHDESGLKYSFFNKKKDGSLTKAQESMKNYNVMDKVEVVFESTEQDYQGKPYTRRTVKWFSAPVGGVEKEILDSPEFQR